MAKKPTVEDIYRSSINFLLPLSLEETYKTIVQEAKRLFNAQFGTIVLLEKGKFTRTYVSSPLFSTHEVSSYGRTYLSLKTKEPYISYVKSEKDIIHPKLFKKGVKMIIFIPLIFRNRNIGVLSIHSKYTKKISLKELFLLKLFGNLASMGIHQAMLYKDLKQSIYVRDLFIAMAAHELRTPLTPVTIFASYIRDKVKKGILPEVKTVETLSIEIKRLTNLINELLTIDNIKSGKLNYMHTKFHMSKMIEHAIIDFKSNYPNYKIKLENILNNKQDIMYGDFEKLIQMMTNLLNNAAKFSSPTDEIVVSVAKEKDTAKVTIKDQGKGIAKKDIKHLYSEFYKGGDKNHSGLGLGLYITKNIVQEHKGTITIHSKKNFGTEVQVSLPLSL